MTTDEIMQMAMDLVGMREMPGDSAVYFPGQNIKKVLFGIDIGVSELLLAKQLGYDAVIAHHPPMTSALPAWQVYQRHIALLVQAGVSEEAAAAAVLPRVRRMKAAFQAANHDHYPSIAKLLQIPFMNIHCPLDELGRRIIQGKIDALLQSDATASLQAVVEELYTLPEFREAQTQIEIAMGEPQAAAGRVVVAHGALTNGGYEVANAYFEHGIDTVLYIHVPYGDLVRLRAEAKGQLIITGHISSDLVGINPFVRYLRVSGIQVDTISGIYTRQGDNNAI